MVIPDILLGFHASPDAGRAKGNILIWQIKGAPAYRFPSQGHIQ
jgi:hypothetical protein